MTPQDWTGPFFAARFRTAFESFPRRPLHLLTAAALRRVWDELPSHHTRLAIEATERFADGHATAEELARIRSTDLIDSGDVLWLGPDATWDDEQLVGGGCECPSCQARADEYVCRVANTGESFESVRSGVREPYWVATQVLLRGREMAGWKADPDDREAAERAEAAAQYDLWQELTGPQPEPPNWPRWRTADVRALARHIDATQAFDVLPILADALQDAGCDDATVLDHCRRPGGHVRGCWVVDAALGRDRDLRPRPAAVQAEGARHRARKFGQFVRYK